MERGGMEVREVVEEGVSMIYNLCNELKWRGQVEVVECGTIRDRQECEAGKSVIKAGREGGRVKSRVRSR